MLAARDIMVAQEIAEDPRAHGQEARAQTVERVLAAALGAASSPELAPGEHLTVTEAAWALSVRRQTVEAWIRTGHLAAAPSERGLSIARGALVANLERLRATRPSASRRTSAELAKAEREYATLEASLPAAPLARMHAPHDKLEAGERLTRSERAELSDLEREVTAAATERLRAAVQQAALARP